MKKLLDKTANGRINEYFDYDPITQKVTIYRQEYVNPVVDFAQALHNEAPLDKDMKLAAMVPDHVLTHALQNKWGDDDWKRWANNSDNDKLRVYKGNL
jgi:hypothetical protein